MAHAELSLNELRAIIALETAKDEPPRINATSVTSTQWVVIDCSFTITGAETFERGDCAITDLLNNERITVSYGIARSLERSLEGVSSSRTAVTYWDENGAFHDYAATTINPNFQRIR